jgi:hypothetical protein
MQMPKLRLSAVAVASIGTFVLAAPAGAQLLEHKDLAAKRTRRASRPGSTRSPINCIEVAGRISVAKSAI